MHVPISTLKFTEIASAIFEGVPEFKQAYDEELDKEAPYLFLSDFGIFVSNGILNKKSYAVKSLRFINSFLNTNIEDKELTNKIIVGVLEALTDNSITQKEASKNFTDHCYKFFDELLTGGLFRDLR